MLKTFMKCFISDVVVLNESTGAA